MRSQPQLVFSFAICKTNRSVSSSIRGRPTRWRNLDPSNLLAISFRYQAQRIRLRDRRQFFQGFPFEPLGDLSQRRITTTCL